MNCNIIKDLIPLYVDDCCCEESAQLVSSHIEECEECRKEYEFMTRTMASDSTPAPQKDGFKKISLWRASVMQSVLLFLSFAVIIAGVILEGNTPYGKTNGLWAMALIVPATGFMLSMANWNFVRLYKSRKTFSNGSLIVSAGFILLCYTWAFLHYQQGIDFGSPLVFVGIGLSLIFCVLSKVLSSRYAILLGRE